MKKEKKLINVNEKMKLNGLPELSASELLSFEKMKRALELEEIRMRSNRKKGVLILSISAGSISLAWYFDVFTWVVELVKLIWK